MHTVKFALFIFTIFILSIYSIPVIDSTVTTVERSTKNNIVERANLINFEERASNPHFSITLSSGEVAGDCSYTFAKTGAVYTSITLNCVSRTNFCIINTYIYVGQSSSPSFPFDFTQKYQGCNGNLFLTEAIDAGDSQIRFAAEVRKYNDFGVSGPLDYYRIELDDIFYLKTYPDAPGGGAGYPFPGNCVDYFNHISVGAVYYDCYAYSFQDPNIPVDYDNMNSINWLINQKLHGYISNGLRDIQYAIWLMVHPGSTVPIPSHWTDDGWTTATAKALRTEALTHSDWIPTTEAGDWDSIIVFCGDDVQDTMYHVKRSVDIAFEDISLTSNVGNIYITGNAYEDCINNDNLDTPYSTVVNQQIQVTYQGVTIATVSTDTSGHFSLTVQVPSSTTPSYVLTLVNYNLTPRTSQVSTGALLPGSTYSFNFLFFDTAGDNNGDGVIDNCYCTTISSTDTTCDGTDDNCNGFEDEGYTPVTTTCGHGPCASTGVNECDDGSIVNTCSPDYSKKSSDNNCNLIDEDCDGTADEDYIAPVTDCGVGVCATHGNLVCSAGETQDTCVPLTSNLLDNNCNLIDEDCDGTADEDYVPPTTDCGLGICATHGNLVCTGGSTHDTCVPLISTLKDDNCNLIDEDCDGPADEDYVPPTTHCGLGVCATTGKLVCSSGSTHDTCTPDLSKKGSDNNCDGLDNDCDGQIDEDYVGPVTNCGQGVCHNTGTLVCENAHLRDTCFPDISKKSSDNNCNSVDNDCDGAVDEDYIPQVVYCGSGVCSNYGYSQCSAGIITNNCSPNTLLASPSDNVCDGIDNDCDGSIDEDYVPTTTTCGFGSCKANGKLNCQNGQLFDTCSPDNTKITSDANCDGIDNDCDGFVDDNYPITPITCGLGSCQRPGSRRCSNGLVIDDCVPLVSTLIDNNCNGIDEDCDGIPDDNYVGPSTTCGTGACKSNGHKVCISGSIQDTCVPDNTKISSDANCDGIDNNCNGVADDGFIPQPTSCGTGFCASNGVTSCLAGSIKDSCTAGSASSVLDNNCNGVDEDCDGVRDDEYVPTPISCGVGACARNGFKQCINGQTVDQCTPGTPAANDQACDGIDNDCDGQVDEDFISTTTSCGIGSCQANGYTICQGGNIIDTCAAGSSFPEICDGNDNNCDGIVDEGYPVSMNCGVGACANNGLKQCINGQTVDQCTPGTPAADDSVCDGIDNDCDGQVDEDFGTITIHCGVGGCRRAGTRKCVLGSIVDTCVAGSPSATDNTCDGVDDNCDGTTDEGYVATPTACGAGVCASSGLLNCVNGQKVDSCTSGSPSNGNTDENCNGLDDNCDGRVDEDFIDTVTTCSEGLCTDTGLLTCDVNGITHDSCVVTPTSTDGSDPCDGIDNDCDGLIDEDYVPTDSTCGVGACASAGTNQCINGVIQNVCNPLSATTSHDPCDGIDNDCDGFVDEDFTSTTTTCGNGVCQANGATSCVNGNIVDSCVAGTTSTTGDPCNGLDDNCNGQVDEDFTQSPSSCGVGACASSGTNQCVNGVITNVCTPLTSTTVIDLCDGIDNDCDGIVDEDYVDNSSTCGLGVCGSTGNKRCIAGEIVDSCVAGSPATGDPCDGKDNDCDGQVDEDFTQSPSSCGVGACASSGTNQCVNGVITNVCTPLTSTTIVDLCDGIDNDCDGLVDEDHVETPSSCGLGVCGSNGHKKCIAGQIVDNCVAGSPTSATDLCDGKDNNCNGLIDEDYIETPSNCGVGACGATGLYKCLVGVIKNICTPNSRLTLIDNCDGIDNDCDGQTDEDATVDSVTCGTGVCKATGITKCEGGHIINTCIPIPPNTISDPCDGFDNDCDGYVDEDFISITTTCGTGACHSNGVTSCVNGNIVDSCVAGTTADSLDENCNGIDDNCNGQIDEGYAPTPTQCGTGACITSGTLTCVNGNTVDSCIPKSPTPDNNCNGIDDNCNGQVDEDYEPYPVRCGTICEVFGQVICTANGIKSTCAVPSSIDFCDGQDNDCDGYVDEDAQNRPITCGLGVCIADGEEECTNGSYEPICTPLEPQSADDNTCDGLDNNCNGETDEGFEGSTITCGTGVCQRTNTTLCKDGDEIDICTPGHPQSSIDVVCDGLDNDCDGLVDEDYVNFPITCGVGACRNTGYKECIDGEINLDCTEKSPLSTDDNTCDGIDDNCNGETDEGFEGSTVTCGLGECINTAISECNDGVLTGNDCVPLSAPSTTDNVCDGKDNDCDGDVDEDYVNEPITCGVGACLRDGEKLCLDGIVTVECTAGTPGPHDAICNGIDDNCDGKIDEGFQPFQGSQYCDPFKCNKATYNCVDGEIVDNCASFLDSDGDSIPDTCDKCAGFDDFNDKDGDTIPDGCDVCPNSNDLNDANQDGIPDGCSNVCGLGVHCNATNGCTPTLPLDCSQTVISNCAVFDCVANGCQSESYSSDYVLNHYFTLTTEGAYDLYRVRGSTSNLIGSDNLGSKEVFWVGLSYNAANGNLYGIDSENVLRKISTYDGKSTIILDFSEAIDGQAVDIAFHPDGTLSVLSLASATLYQAYEFALPSTTPIFSSSIQRNNIDIRAFTWDAFGYYLYFIDASGSYYKAERSLSSTTTVSETCFTFSHLSSLSVAPKGLAMSVNGTLLTGWGYSSNKIAYSQVDSRDCFGEDDFLQKLSITSASVVYTAFESCVRPAGVSSGGGGGGGSSSGFPGDTTNNVLENYPTTAVATGIAGGFLAICAAFAVLLAINSSKSKEEVPLDTILDTSEASAITHDNAIYLNGVSSVQNTMYT